MLAVAMVNCRRTVEADSEQPDGKRTQPLRAQRVEENKSN